MALLDKKNLMLKIGREEIPLKEVMASIQDFISGDKFDLSKENERKTFALFLMVKGIEIGINKTLARLKNECDAADIEFKTLQQYSDLIQKINLTLIPAKGEA
jgi:hypothetical protein